MTKISTELYHGKVLRLCREVHTLPNGRSGNYEIIHHSGGAAILPLLESGDVLLMRQFRATVGKMVIEIPAGRLDPGETPAECARRELQEETGYRATKIIDLGTTLPSVGYTDERIHLFAATGLVAGEDAREEHEFIELFSVPLQEALNMCADGRIDDAKSQLALLLYQQRCTSESESGR